MEWISLAAFSTTAQLLLLLLAASSALLLRRWGRRGRPAKHWPPGPPAWPVIGHLHLLGKRPHQSLCKLSSTYGPLMGLRLGSVRAIVASSPQMAKAILQTQDLTFANRPRIAAAVHMNFNCRNMAFAPNCGPLWKRMRQLCATELFTAKRLASLRHVREDEVRELVRGLAKIGQKGKEAVELRPSVKAAINNMMCRMVVGKRIAEVSSRSSEALGAKQEDLLSLIEELMRLLGVFYIGDFIPWLWWWDPHGHLKRMKAVGRRLKAIMQDVIHDRRQERGGSEHWREDDLLDVLLNAADHHPPTQQDVRMTDDNIMALILDLFAGGTDTSSLTIEWALADLISNERVIHKLRNEIEKVVGNERLVKESDLENLPYLTLVIKESMRLHPIAPLLLPRESSTECQIGDYKILSKTRAYVNTWALGRDSSLWEMPLKFWPERFENNLDLRGKTYEVLPFGAGRKGCPGVALGVLNVNLVVATLVQGFTFSLGARDSQNHEYHSQSLDMTENFGRPIAMNKPLCMYLTPKLPLDLF